MRQITEVLRLNAQGLSYRQIAQSVGISASTVQSYLERAQRVGLSWPLSDDVDDAALEARLKKRWKTEMWHAAMAPEASATPVRVRRPWHWIQPTTSQ